MTDVSSTPPQLPKRRPRRFKTSRTVLALMLREMISSYGRNAGGYVWALAEPVGAITLLAVVFSIALRNPPIGTSFALFYAAGYLPFMLYTDIGQKVALSIKYSRPLLAYPAVRYMDSIMARFVLNTITHLLVFCIVTVGIIEVLSLTVIVDLPAICLGLLMAAVLGLGIGVLNCFLFAVIPVWERVWGILTRPLFIISGILFIFDRVPEPYSDYLWYNPLVHVVGQVRRGMFSTYDAAYVSHMYLFSVAIIALILGLVFLNRYHRYILNEA